MNNTIITLAIAFAAVSAQAADTRAAAATVTKALTCEIADGKAAAVVKAVKALGAKPGKDENDYVLASPITVFGSIHPTNNCMFQAVLFQRADDQVK